MPRPPKKGEAKKINEAKKQQVLEPVVSPQEPLNHEELQNETDNLRFIALIEIVRTSSITKHINDSFNEIFEKLKPRIQKMINRFTIPGLGPDDIMQESMIALRYKAIKDYDKTRGSCEGPAPFDRFALLCIRRHLSTEFKSSLQNNRKKVLNQSISIDQENRSSSMDDMSLSSIIPSDDGDILECLQNKEYFRNLMTNLVKQLSKFEREVLSLYSQRFSYEEIADRINEKRVKIKVDVKGIDNALSRLKKKAKRVFNDQEEVEIGDAKDPDDIPNRVRRTKKQSKAQMEDED